MGIEKYKDIIEHEHHVSLRHQRMSALDRAAQFAPFAALTGYDEVIRETGRQTDSRIELDEESVKRLNDAIAGIAEHIDQKPSVNLTVFEKDARKHGGRYITVSGKVRTIDSVQRMITFVGGRKISLDDIAGISLEALD